MKHKIQLFAVSKTADAGDKKRINKSFSTSLEGLTASIFFASHPGLYAFVFHLLRLSWP